ncbi:MAG: RNA 2',3'-cyclic phosphodiesterase [Deltaproteobacteria bacterium]|nr:RNA 2',3'-cyclic phosphodiesterase [Deltaproteobacteria bacterium]
MIRSFLAFELPPEIKNIINRVSKDLRQSDLNVRWVNVENIHLTIVFMGNIHEKEIPFMSQTIEKVCLRYAPFHVFLKGLGAFPNTRRPRVIWAGLDGDTSKMPFFQKALQKHLRPVGIKEEKRPFKPHLTLGRFKNPGPADSLLDNLIGTYKDLSSSEYSFRELIFFKSDIKPGGAVYTKLGSWPLLGGGTYPFIPPPHAGGD